MTVRNLYIIFVEKKGPAEAEPFQSSYCELDQAIKLSLIRLPKSKT
jgi:hypothetical protein